MSLVYKHGQRYGLIPRSEESNPLLLCALPRLRGTYEAIILTPRQDVRSSCLHLPEPERTLDAFDLLAQDLRISEMPGPAMAGCQLR